MNNDEYYRSIASLTYRKAIDAWLADLKAGKIPERHIWALREYLILAIAKALAEERHMGFNDAEQAPLP